MNPIILALDTSDLSAADRLLSEVRDSIGMVKVGLELWYAHGAEALKMCQHYNIPVFLDLKLHDIPNTVAQTVSVLLDQHGNKCDIRFLSVHCFGGKEMLTSALSASRGSNTTITAVTLLTSLNYKNLQWMGFRDSRENIKTSDLAVNSAKCGITSFVCSPQNSGLIRKNVDINSNTPPVALITPGIRPNGYPEDDQKRTCDVNTAIKNGSSWLVIGRPITKDANPKSAAAELAGQAFKAIDKWGKK